MTQPSYFPPSGEAWERADPASVGMDSSQLQAAAAFACAHETNWSRDIGAMLDGGYFERAPWNEALGPTAPRGGPSGLILRGGRIVAEWGDTARPDMTFSVAKSYLSICAGLAQGAGLLPDFEQPVADLVKDGGFEPPHNSRIVWRHLLQQTSEWEGVMWDKPDLVDRNRDLATEGKPGAKQKGEHRDLLPPGEFWEYNDVRVNRLSLALMRVWKRPLPEVLAEKIMGPIGASPNWRWHGYRNSWVDVDGQQMQSVPGGAHWGGGLFISTRDHARVALLMAQRGVWNGQSLLPDAYFKAALAPCPIMPTYGFCWWLNTGRAFYPAAPETSYFGVGAGSSILWIDPALDLVAVIRWIGKDDVNGFVAEVIKALNVD
jgi:CubicO group peptidase (beta-lactamase class C family)